MYTSSYEAQKYAEWTHRRYNLPFLPDPLKNSLLLDAWNIDYADATTSATKPNIDSS